MVVTRLENILQVFKPTKQYFEGQQVIYEHLGDTNRVNYYKGMVLGMKLVLDVIMEGVGGGEETE